MSCLETPNPDSDPDSPERTAKHSDITFLYKLVDGLASSSHGLNVARMAGLPEKVLDVANEKRLELERVVRVRVEERKRARMGRILKGLVELKVGEGGGKVGERLVEMCQGVVVDAA
jgi:DNA mismatch repair ATPase MutS